MSAQDNDTLQDDDNPTVYEVGGAEPGKALDAIHAAIPAVIRDCGNMTPGIIRAYAREFTEGVYTIICEFAVVNAPLFFTKPYRTETYAMHMSKGVALHAGLYHSLIRFIQEARHKLIEPLKPPVFPNDLWEKARSPRSCD